MITRIIVAAILLIAMSSAPALAQYTKCRFEGGRMICCDNYGLCN